MSVPSELIERARAVPIGHVTAERGIRLRGRIEQVGPCPICGGSDRFAINVKKQVFNCRACGGGGDVIALVQFLDNCSFRDALECLAGKCETPVSHLSFPTGISRLPNQHDDHGRSLQREKARSLWRASSPSAGTLAETYLAQVRGIAPPYPATLRFLAPLGHGQHPAMLVPFGIPDEPEPGTLVIKEEQISAVHLTLLKPDGSGKIDAKPNKMTIASPGGMPMVLAPLNDLLGLSICEGVEDALSVHRATGLGAWAAGGATFMPKLITAIDAASPECITILVDDDDVGQRSARELADLLVQRGIEVLVEGLST